MPPAAALAILFVLIVVVSLTWALSRSRREARRIQEAENERSGNFRSSQNPNDPHCPRCHGRGVLIYGFARKQCELCGGTKHVSYGA